VFPLGVLSSGIRRGSSEGSIDFVTERAGQTGLDASPVAKQRRVKDILKSTVIVGGGSLVTVLTGVVRGKVISLAVGPAGIGLQGLLGSTMRTTTAVAGMGMQTSGVREVARLRGEHNTDELGHTLRAIRLATLALGGFAALVLVLFHRPLGSQLLDDSDLGWTLAVVGFGVLAQVYYAVYDSYLRGFRRVALLTKANIIANLLATGAAISFVLLLGDDGIAWAIVSQPISMLAIAAIAGRDFRLHLVPANRDRTRAAFKRVVRMGVVLAATSFITTGVQLTARVLVAHWGSLDDVGYFQGAWAVSVLYLGFVLGSMSLDYYPRLAEMGANSTALTQMINEQAKVSFLLAGPALLGLLAFSSQVVTLLYSSKFGATVQILRWQLLGDVLKIGSWTLSYMVLAQGRPRVYFMTELSWNVAYLAVLAALLPHFGVVTATGAAYVCASAVYFSVLCFVTNRLVGFSWTRTNMAPVSNTHLTLPTNREV
jgi:antigen flippase